MRSDLHPVDCRTVIGRQARGRPQPQALIPVHQQDRAQRPGQPLFHQPHDGVKHGVQPGIPDDHFQNLALCRCQRLGVPAVRHINDHAPASDSLAISIIDHFPPLLQHPLLPVRPQNAILVFQQARPMDRTCPPCLQIRTVIGVHQPEKRLVRDLKLLGIDSEDLIDLGGPVQVAFHKVMIPAAHVCQSFRMRKQQSRLLQGRRLTVRFHRVILLVLQQPQGLLCLMQTPPKRFDLRLLFQRG